MATQWRITKQRGAWYVHVTAALFLWKYRCALYCDAVRMCNSLNKQPDMSHLRDLDEYSDRELENELQQRREREAQGVCSYCGRPGYTPTCKFENRHLSKRYRLVQFPRIGGTQTVLLETNRLWWARLRYWLTPRQELATAVMERGDGGFGWQHTSYTK